MFTVVLVVITMILSTILSVYATTTILGSEVSYTDNKGINATNVQAAIDNTYSSALSLDTRVTSLEGKVSGTTKIVAHSGTITLNNAGYSFIDTGTANVISITCIRSDNAIIVIPCAVQTQRYLRFYDSNKPGQGVLYTYFTYENN